MNNTVLRHLVSVALAAWATSAQAHVTLQVPEAAAGSYYKAVFTVPHGCSGSATTELAIKIPEGFIAVKPQVKTGWRIDTQSGPYKTAHELHSVPITEGVQVITWSGGALPDDRFDEFAVVGYLLPELKAGSSLYFPTVQTCEQEVVRWIEIPAEGQAWDDVEFPAPVLRLMQPGHE